MNSAGPAALKSALIAQAHAAGFDVAGVTGPGAGVQAGIHFQEFLRLGRHGSMDWLAAKADRRSDPLVLWPEAKSLILLGMNYGPAENPMEKLLRASRGNISCYAQGRDYHDLIKRRLKQVARWLHGETGAAVKVFVDTAPVMEKPLAASAGLGWQGKHTNLVSRQFGSWLFLGAIFTEAHLPRDAPETDHCGTCRACLDICPTQAFPGPYRLDARRCISYLTIEHKGQIDREFRKPMGNRIYGCDDCLAVCPWNKWAQAAREAAFNPLTDDSANALAQLLRLDDAAFRARFAGSPVKRTGRDRFVRNCLIAAGNSGDRTLRDAVLPLLRDAAPLVRAMAVWAARQLMDGDELAALRAQHLAGESDADVRAEWE
ncbi:MAG: epoxyqueuosine reductase [Alphaproteobacteria bacterium]|nr:epoxyqueuosine reductase [Alphaproteobacteria bacterium]